MGVKKITTKSKTEGDVLILYLKGEISSTSLEDFKGVIKTTLEQGHRRLILSLIGIDYIDSSGIGAIMGTLLSVKRVGGDLKIADAEKFVSQLFHILEIEKVIPVFPNVEAALAEG